MNLVYAVNKTIGKITSTGLIRELFVISHLENADCKVFFSKQGDIKCESYTFEIGGAGKNNKQIRNVKNAYLVKDDILISTGQNIPLYLFGFLY